MTKAVARYSGVNCARNQTGKPNDQRRGPDEMPLAPIEQSQEIPNINAHARRLRFTQEILQFSIVVYLRW